LYKDGICSYNGWDFLNVSMKRESPECVLICRPKQGQGIFVAYTLGPHTGLGTGVAEVQLMVTVGALLRAVRLELETPNYEIKTKLMPISGHDPKFKIRVVENRKI
jgi:hypothetical protein